MLSDEERVMLPNISQLYLKYIYLLNFNVLCTFIVNEVKLFIVMTWEYKVPI